ncbi:PREDICTED: uncharacterized protein LOC109483867 [Branchiostoma belcheri]|uniref:Uncharacterized protein LOC109483867 n=1 Tax=Branchiostoma belcheri TaxID=7741 RepID=A0A6P5A8N7_BRABE|nr:PREDICTED: uncharacterized protein LOC109483867 [Branchiostoma belcheri]
MAHLTQDMMTKKAGRLENISGKTCSRARHKGDVLSSREDSGRHDTFEIFSRLKADSKQNSVQDSKANVECESIGWAEMHVDHSYCYNNKSGAQNCRTVTLTATPGKNTNVEEEFRNDHDYSESKKSVLQFELGSDLKEVSRDEESNFEAFEEDSKRGYCVPEFDPLFEEDSRRGYCVPELAPLFEEDSRRGYCVPELDPLFEEDSRRGYCVPELDPTANKKEAKEVFAALMRAHNSPSGRPLHHRVEPWCVRVWREGVRGRESFPRVVRIKYRTTPGGGSLTWVTDQDGKPCVFTQGSCINNRSLFPCHDFLTMATWQAVIHSPHGTTVLMSGEEPGAPCQPDAIAKQPDEGTLMSGEEPGAPWQLDAVAKQPDEGILVAKQTEPGALWQPEDAAWQPDAVAKQPDAVAKQPDAVAKQPDEGTLIAKQTGPGSLWQPEDATWQPDAVAKQPDAVARQPDAVTKQPDAVAKQPVSVAKQPDAVAKQPDAVTTQPDAVAKQPDAVTKQPNEGTLVTKQTNSAQEVQFASMDLPLANELTSFSDHEQMHEGVASVAKQFDVAKQPADTGACSEVAARDHHYFYVTMPMPCSTLALAVGYWLQASSEGSTTQKHNHGLQPSVHSGNAQEMVDYPQPNQGENYCEVAPPKQFDADNTSQHEESINPPTCTLPSVQVTVEPVEQHVDHSGMDHVSQIPEQVCQQEKHSHHQRSRCKCDPVRVIPHRVFAPSIHVQQAGREFLPLIEKYLAAAYDVLGPHPLPRLDVLVVPRCFASLGLASPHLMLVSQSLLAGDGSMCLRLAHEIAHSWFGLLIGSRDWTEEWISEGFATYLEDCIHAKAMGWTEKDHEEYSGLRAAIRYRLLAAELENTEEELQTLRPSASGQGFHQGDGTVYVTNALNTDKLFTQVHYLKGYFLLRYFARKVGADKFHSLLKSFVQEFPRHGMNLIFSQDFFKLVFKTFPSLTSQGLTVEGIYQDWLDCPGLPKQLQKNPVNANNRLVKQVRVTLRHCKNVDRQNKQNERTARKMARTSGNPTSLRRKKRQRQIQTVNVVGDSLREENKNGKNAGKRRYDVTEELTQPNFSSPPCKRQAMGNDVPNANELESSGQLHDNQSDVPLRSDLPTTSLIHEGGVRAHDSRAKEPGRELLQDQLVLLLEELLEMKSMAGVTLQQLEEHYRLSRCNADVRHRWCELVIKHGYRPGYSDVQQFLCEDQAMGVYLYGELMMYQRPQQQQLAWDTFQLLSQEMEEGPRKAVQDMMYGGQGDNQAMGV